MIELSPVLIRQIQKIYGSDFDLSQMDEKFIGFVELIELTYENAKKERDRNKHTLKIVDEEFVGLLERLQSELDEKEATYVELRNLVLKLEESKNPNDLSDENLVKIIQELVNKRLVLQNNLETSLQMIQEQNKQKSDFLSFMSHEIRTPLNIIFGISQMLTKEEYLPEQAENLLNLESITGRTIDLVTKVIDFEKLELNSSDGELKKINLKSFGDSLKRDFQPLGERQGNQIVFEYLGDAENYYELDEFRLRQICSNLISNAVKFTENGKIIIRIEEEIKNDVSKLVFRVIDNGRGMSETEVNSLFQKFSDSKLSENEEIVGSGLGLYFSSKLLEAMGSKMAVKSIKDIGSEFYFTILSKKGTFVNEGKIEKSKADGSDLQGKRILVSDDSLLNQKLVTKILEKEGVECFVACNGYEILDIVDEQELDLILLDINMPEMDGLETAKRLKDKRSTVKIMPLTADTNSEKIQKFSELGINDIIYKPYKIDDFIAAVSEKISQ